MSLVDSRHRQMRELGRLVDLDSEEYCWSKLNSFGTERDSPTIHLMSSSSVCVLHQMNDPLPAADLTRPGSPSMVNHARRLPRSQRLGYKDQAVLRRYRHPSGLSRLVEPPSPQRWCGCLSTCPRRTWLTPAPPAAIRSPTAAPPAGCTVSKALLSPMGGVRVACAKKRS